eukprot:2116374-Alexandrium_andersonii.AAC.1
MKALDEARAALAKEVPVEHDDFRVTVLGGKFTAAKTGKPFDYIVAMSRGQAAKDFCIRHFEPHSFRCSYAKYGSKAAGVLCRAWAHRA